MTDPLSQNGSLRSCDAVLVTPDLESFSQKRFVVVYLSSTTSDPTNTVGTFIYTQLHSTRFQIINSVFLATFYMTLKTTVIVFFLKVIQFIMIFRFYY